MHGLRVVIAVKVVLLLNDGATLKHHRMTVTSLEAQTHDHVYRHMRDQARWREWSQWSHLGLRSLLCRRRAVRSNSCLCHDQDVAWFCEISNWSLVMCSIVSPPKYGHSYVKHGISLWMTSSNGTVTLTVSLKFKVEIVNFSVKLFLP